MIFLGGSSHPQSSAHRAWDVMSIDSAISSEVATSAIPCLNLDIIPSCHTQVQRSAISKV